MTFLEKHPELLGLGEEEARVYTFLNKVGESPAKVISAECKVPFSRIHQVLYRLQQKELTLSRGEAPKMFCLRSKDPDLAKHFEQKKPGKQIKRENGNG